MKRIIKALGYGSCGAIVLAIVAAVAVGCMALGEHLLGKPIGVVVGLLVFIGLLFSVMAYTEESTTKGNEKD